MVVLKILACIATVLVCSCLAAVPYDDVKFNIFDQNLREFESNVLQSIEFTKNFYAQKKDDAAARTNAAIELFGKVLPLIRSILAKQSDWRDSVTTTNIESKNLLNAEIRYFNNAINEKFDLLTDGNLIVYREQIASEIHTELAGLIKHLDRPTSFPKKHPLAFTPPLLQLAALVAIFSPAARTLIPLSSEHDMVACKMLDLLVDFRPRTVYERLEKLHTTNTQFRDVMMTVRAKPYNSNGYSESNTMDCVSKGCADDGVCLKDDFSVDELSYAGNDNHPQCLEDYASYVKHRVENLFPINALEEACVNSKSRTPTGSGWATIHIRHVNAYGNSKGDNCDLTNSCDPYIVLSVNEKFITSTERNRVDTCCFDANIRFVTEKIPKSSTIEVKVWDDDKQAIQIVSSRDELIQHEEGSIESFIEKPVRYGAKNGGAQNAIEIFVFWTNEYN